MSKNRITVYHNGNGMVVSRVVADRFNLSNGQRLNSVEQFWEVLGANTIHNLNVIRLAKQITNN